ncbi:hypothetical protein OUZ56_007235 [Daphnia magna]|uniref:Uncharacterized protein n=1 Tax=Daphnia magna TaxID=35525 RepID=A0ABQ9YY05_9CRUS|nr:hypothetical protein OUZ56_007235 [Daphnia magna]
MHSDSLAIFLQNSCQYETLTLRKITSPQEWKIVHQQTIHQFNVRRIQMDDSYIYTKLPYGKTHVAIASTHRFNCPATMAIETLEATSYFPTGSLSMGLPNPAMRKPESSDDRHVMAKHSEIYPSKMTNNGAFDRFAGSRIRSHTDARLVC